MVVLLLDCGEGTRRQCNEARMKLKQCLGMVLTGAGARCTSGLSSTLFHLSDAGAGEVVVAGPQEARPAMEDTMLLFGRKHPVVTQQVISEPGWVAVASASFVVGHVHEVSVRVGGCCVSPGVCRYHVGVSIGSVLHPGRGKQQVADLMLHGAWEAEPITAGCLAAVHDPSALSISSDDSSTSGASDTSSEGGDTSDTSSVASGSSASEAADGSSLRQIVHAGRAGEAAPAVHTVLLPLYKSYVQQVFAAAVCAAGGFRSYHMPVALPGKGEQEPNAGNAQDAQEAVGSEGCGEASDKHRSLLSRADAAVQGAGSPEEALQLLRCMARQAALRAVAAHDAQQLQDSEGSADAAACATPSRVGGVKRQRPAAAEPPWPGCELAVSVLGTGAATPSALRGNTALLLSMVHSGDTSSSADASFVMLDCGEGAVCALQRLAPGLVGGLCEEGVSPLHFILRRLAAVWISHHHADHVSGLPLLLQCRAEAWGGTAPPPLPVTIPHTLRAAAAHWSAGPAASVTWAAHSTHSVEVARVAGGTALHLASVPVRHCAGAMAALVTAQAGSHQRRLVFSGDTMPCTRLCAAAAGCHLLVHEATFECEEAEQAARKRHSTVAQAVAAGQAVHASGVLLTHFSQRYSAVAPECPEALPGTAVPVAPAYDGVVVPWHGDEDMCRALVGARCVHEAWREEVEGGCLPGEQGTADATTQTPA